MVKTIKCFNRPLGYRGLGHVTIVANGYVMVVTSLPVVNDFAHDVAVGAGIRVVADIAEALCVNKRIKPQSTGDSKGHEHCSQQDEVAAVRWRGLSFRRGVGGKIHRNSFGACHQWTLEEKGLELKILVV